MSVLLDTNACIAAINTPASALRERLTRYGSRRSIVATSAVVVFELRFGIAKSKRIAENTTRTDLFLQQLQILPFEEEDAGVAGEIRFALQKSGTPIGPYDILIAAQALRHNLTLVTANVREFSRVKGLRWEDWSK